MTEQEAKALAGELEHNRDWRVMSVGEGLLSISHSGITSACGGWGILLHHRRKAWISYIDNPDMRIVRASLADADNE